MWFMTVNTIFCHIGMLINERPLILHVTLSASRLDRHTNKLIVVSGTMWIMAIDTDDLPFRNRMMREVGKFHFLFKMALVTELGRILATDFLLRSLVQSMTVKAGDITGRMWAGIPVLQDGR